MNEEPGNLSNKAGNGLRYLRLWLILVAGRSNAFPVPAQPQSPAADVLLALSKYDGVP